ncbi:molybdate ABC transporter, ATPase subunit [Methylocella silvestris BL2]|uniref:Molybdate ABC transporter, ATPase subunit n=1 Tax=Methylocella silvestris (strain DSM 15510 / CIP 108128 / LMG 27833 / NCIMB 13906 / BL2) TaxID=395965 RepID=B8EL48_METSB|nr:molybdenum ABC transporter ATP-binding protein [Methylocella silvestris]ACK49043.1 molybdate ABC transporter, ATPase subunit [Methylocella silvestris BL2]
MIEVDVGLDLGTFKLDVAFGNGQGITALFGPSGCGKSLTLGLIAGLSRPTRGYINLDGQPLVDVEKGVFLPPYKRRIGLVFQDSYLFPHLSVRHNLLYGRWFAPPGRKEIEFDAVIATLGIDKLLGRRPARLSGGERQRVGIGRALLSCPRLLLFDEPLAALDMSRKLEIMPLIERIRDDFKVPIVYVSHAIEEVVRLADRVVVLQAGKVKVIGSPNEVFGADVSALDDRFDRSSALSVIVGDADAVYGLTNLIHPAGTIWMVGPAGARGRSIRIVIKATDVILATAPPPETSIRNVLAGAVKSIYAVGPLAIVDITLDGAEHLAAVATRQAVDELRLQPGSRVFALIKATAIDERMVDGSS